MPSPEEPAALDAQFARPERQAPAYVGLAVDAARLLARDEDVEDVRVVSLDDGSVVMTLDHRPSRLNLLVRNGDVVRAAYF